MLVPVLSWILGSRRVKTLKFLVRVAHASRVPGEAVSGSRTLAAVSTKRKKCFGGTPKPARETRALPGGRRGAREGGDRANEIARCESGAALCYRLDRCIISGNQTCR